MMILDLHFFSLLDELPWPFLVSTVTASLFLTLSAVFFVLGLDLLFVTVYFFNLDSGFSESMMLGSFSTKCFFTKTKSVLSNSVSIFFKNYSNQVILDNIFRARNSISLDNLVQDSMRHNLIDPIKNQNVSIHQLDIMSQISIKKFNISFSDLLIDFDINNFFVNRHTNFYLAQAQINFNKNLTIQNYHQRSNTIAETCALQASKSNLTYLKSIDMSYNKKINTISTKLTGNKNPDYACCIVWQNGLCYQYHADLKITKLSIFENRVLHLHPNAIVNTNFYWIDDKNFDENYVFSGVTKIRLEDTYNGVIQFYAKLDPVLAREMFNQSVFAFNRFKKTGLVKDYNDIRINTPKFILCKWIDNLF